MTKTMNQIRREINSMRRKKKQMSYQSIADRYSMPEKQINAGTVYQIHNYGHEPHDDEIRSAFDLGPKKEVLPCQRCGKVHKLVKGCRRGTRRRRIIRRWSDLPPDLLRAAIEDRVEFDETKDLVRE